MNAINDPALRVGMLVSSVCALSIGLIVLVVTAAFLDPTHSLYAGLLVSSSSVAAAGLTGLMLSWTTILDYRWKIGVLAVSYVLTVAKVLHGGWATIDSVALHIYSSLVMSVFYMWFPALFLSYLAIMAVGAQKLMDWRTCQEKENS